MYNKLTSRGCLSIAIAFLCVAQAATLCGLAVLWFRSSRKPEIESLVVINYDDPFIAQRATEFDLPQVIMQYDQVINAIEEFHQDQGRYPPDLAALVPSYLPREPGLYIQNGERLTYQPEPMTSYSAVAPFTLMIYGHYPGLASMHGWFLFYCPDKYDGCKDGGDRHTQQYHINSRWVWINSSAL